MTPPITHAAIVARVIAEQCSNSRTSANQFRSNCRSWCAVHACNLDAPAERTLGHTFDAKLVEYQELLNRTHPGQPRAGKNIRTAAVKLRATYLAMLGSQDLPTDFNGAFKAALDAKGMTPAQLNRLLQERYYQVEQPTWYGAQLWAFYGGTAGPGTSWKGDSRLLLQRCEEVLNLEAGTLTTRGYPTVEPVKLGTGDEIPYRMARSAQWDASYAVTALPTQVAKIFNAYVEWRFKREHFVNGILHTVEDRSRWTKPASADIARHMLKRFIGWLCLPAPTRPLTDLSEQERWRCGRGMHPNDVRMAHLLDLNLLWDFIEYLRFRQHNQVLTTSHVQLLLTVNAFVSMPHSFLPAHPELAAEFGFAEPTSTDDWLAQVEARHKQILKLIRSVKRMAEPKQRSPDEPLRHVIEDPAPYALFIEMIDRLEQAPPLRANTQRWSVWARDVALFRMQSEVPLRARNLTELTLGRHLKKDPQTSLWQLHVPKAELKNFYSGHAEDIRRPFSKVTSDAIDRYCDDARPNFVGAAESSCFFLGPAAGRRGDAEFVARAGYKLSTDAIDDATRKHLRTYFGEEQGVTIFRHVIATSILKDDPTRVDVAAAVLNNSSNAIRESYKHLTQRDTLRLANSWFQEQRGRKGDKGGKS